MPMTQRNLQPNKDRQTYGTAGQTIKETVSMIHGLNMEIIPATQTKKKLSNKKEALKQKRSP